MKIVLNGRPKECPERASLGDVVAPLETGGVKFAALVNGDVVRRAARASRLLRDGDRVDLLTLAGGG